MGREFVQSIKHQPILVRDSLLYKSIALPAEVNSVHQFTATRVPPIMSQEYKIFEDRDHLQDFMDRVAFLSRQTGIVRESGFSQNIFGQNQEMSPFAQVIQPQIPIKIVNGITQGIDSELCLCIDVTREAWRRIVLRNGYLL